jgi:hypothetical protein
VTWYRDSDGDSFGDPFNTVDACTQPDGYVEDNTDCDDSDGNVNPGAEEKCNDIDDNCSGETDEGCDDDGDTYCDDAMEVIGTPAVCINGGGDCDDSNSSINPGASETCNGLDDDCDGIEDNGTASLDCFDNLSCTEDTCSGGSCINALLEFYCLIDGTCYSDGEENPLNDCEECSSANALDQWTPKTEGTPCEGGTCQSGVCTPE